MLRVRLLLLFLSFGVVSGCAPAILPDTLSPVPVQTASTAPASFLSPIPTERLPTTTPLPVSPTPTREPEPSFQPATALPSLRPVILTSPGPAYETLLQIPVGVGGIRYSGLSIPNALAVLPDRTFLIADPTDNRLLRYSPDAGLIQIIDLYLLDIVNVSDLIVTGDEIYLLEISFNVAPLRYRVSRLTFDGSLVAQYDIPAGHWFEDGLYGLGPAGESGEILLEFYGSEFRYFQLTDLMGARPADLDSLTAYGRTYLPVFGSFIEPVQMPAILVNDQRIESRNTLGGLVKILNLNPDGSMYALREDMVNDFPVIQGDITTHYLSPDGTQLGAARYPIVEWVSFVQRQVAVGPDGEVYGLLPRRATVDIVHLLFYQSLSPLIPNAEIPLVGHAPGE